MRNQLGYALLEQGELKSDLGLPGHRTRFARDDRGHPDRFWLALFVSGDDLFVVEAGGPADAFDSHRHAIEQAIGSLQP